MARRRRVVWSEPAAKLLSDALGFLVEREPGAAERFARDVDRAAASLAYLSERGRYVPELLGTGTREIFVHRYRLMYQVRGGLVVVVAFVHGRRRFDS